MNGSNYPRLTLLRQIIAYQIVVFQTLRRCSCDIFIDTVGVGFAYPLVRLLFGVKVISYTHYPTISSDMLKQIDSQQFNNNLANAPVYVKVAKRLYYRILMLLYSLCGKFASQVATNGSWTDGHIRKLWGDKPSTVLIYPPCDTSDIVEKIPLETQGKKNQMISFAQFRPEKDHELQLMIWKDALPNLPKDAQFVMIGATRGPED